MTGKSIFERIEGHAESLLARRASQSVTSASDVMHATATVNRIHPPRIRVFVDQVSRETRSSKTFRLTPEQGCLPPFQAGQYVSLYTQVGDVHTCRPYSITSVPSAGQHYEITVKRMPDAFVSGHLVDNLAMGDELEISAPDGQFYYNPLIHGHSLIMLAGGSGITPIMSIIRDLTTRRPEVGISLLYGSSRPDDIIFHDALDAISHAHSQFSVTHVLSEPPPGFAGPSGFISADLIRGTGCLETATVFVCGPQAMNHHCLRILGNLGVPRKRIRTELFGPPDDVSQCDGWPQELSPTSKVRVEIAGGKSFAARTGEPLLAAFERNRVGIPAICRTGQCCMCRVKILKGTIFEPPESGRRRSDRWFGYANACMSYPVTDLLIAI